MAGDFYKGEKKKKKQQENKNISQFPSNAPTFTLPKVIEKKKPNQ
jgi:small neutral amino acid transporter SnatA (MarC family)